MPFDTSKLASFPTLPGVYLMKNRVGAILYVGKAKNVRQRVRQYFAGGDEREMVPFLLPLIEQIDVIVVNSEKEALLLEINLIKQHRPKYNALLKDDKTFIALKVNPKQEWPRVDLVRYRGQPKADGLYFGPYPSAFAARNTLDLLQKVFPLRQCSDQEFARRTRPCILYDMKRCIAPCVHLCTKAQYDALVNQIIQFLRGEDEEVINNLQTQMQKAADALEFERAAEILKMIQQIERTVEKQHVDRPLGISGDVLGIYRQGDEVMLSLLNFHAGRLLGSSNHHFSRIAEDDPELLSTFILQHYQFQTTLPRLILLPNHLEDEEALSEILSANMSYKVQLLTPVKGDKRQLIEMAKLNAEAAFKKEKDANAIRERTLSEMQQKLRLTRYPEKIECFDNSHLSGDEPVAALVAFKNGEKVTSSYRRYKLRSIDPSDDYGAMHEVLSRRFRDWKDQEDLPDLIIIDGGKGHLNIALKVLHELNIISVDVIGLAKEEGRHDKGTTAEQIFLPNVKDPIIFPKHSATLFFLQKIRDEAHRFAITFQKHRRSKKLIRSGLESIPGIGPAKRKALLRYFGSLKQIGEATPDELKKVKGITEANIEAIRRYFQQK